MSQPFGNLTENTGTSASTVHRMSASPRSIKTQIAKLSYPNTSKEFKRIGEKNKHMQAQKLRQSKEPVSKVSDTAPNQFSRKKDERKKGDSELNSYINVKAADIDEECSKVEEVVDEESPLTKDNEFEITTITTFRRCKTELVSNKPQTERRTKARIGAKVRSKSTNSPDTKFHALLPSTLCTAKSKSYNVEEARKFLDAQKRRRRFQPSTSEVKANSEKTAFEKEQIKKRLEELRKNSRAIIMNHVNRKKTPLFSKNASNIGKTKKQLGNVVPVEPSNINDNIVENINKSSDKTIASVTIKSVPERPENKADSIVVNLKDGAASENGGTQNLSQVIKDNKTIPIQKHVGLLRKAESKDHSFSAIKEFSFDKENIALDMMTPKLRQRMPSEAKAISKGKDVVAITSDQEEESVEVTYSNPISVKKTLETLLPDKHKNSEETKVHEGIDPNPINCKAPPSTLNVKNYNGQQNDLPYWLKPSAVQIYPYNFIMAVRRKLEALADVKQIHSRADIKHKTTSTKDLFSTRSESEQLKGSKTIKELIPQSIKQSYTPVSKNIFEETVVNPSSETNHGNVSQSKNDSARSQPDVNSNISSISIEFMPSSNTVSRNVAKKSISLPLSYSKAKAATHPSEDDTTISSSIFNSSERNTYHKNTNIDRNNIEYLQRSISPLSLERVENLTITPNKNLSRAIAARHVNTNRGDEVQSRIIEDKHANNKSIQHGININQLLDDFNRSLSHVIAVSDQLKTTVKKTHNTCGAQNENIKPKESEEYTEDFEYHSSQRSQDTNSGLDIENEQNNTANTEYKISSRSEAIKTLQFLSSGAKLNREFSPGKVTSIGELCSNSSLCSHTSVASQETHSYTKRKLVQYESDERQKIERVKEKVMQNIITTEKNRNSRADHFQDVIKEPENSKQKEATNNVPANNAMEREQQEYSKSASIIDNVQSEEKKVEGPNNNISKSPSIDLHEQKQLSHTVQRNEAGLYKRQLLPTFLRSSHKLVEMFDSSNLEFSMGSTNNDSLSDSTYRYSNVGLYEKLIRNETTKSEHLYALLKMREKALFDRTKGQIALLEVQKERCKSKGLLQQITAIKKKQRGILLKMEKEREEIKRLLQSTTTTTSTDSYGKRASKESELTTKFGKNVISQKFDSISIETTQLEHNEKIPAAQVKLPQTPPVKVISKYPRSNLKLNGQTTHSLPAVRANYSLESSHPLEELLRKRESDLRRRREHVECLIQWHRQLDQEEAEVLQMENELLTYNTNKIHFKSIESKSNSEAVLLKGFSTHAKARRRLKEIENSLRELNSISLTQMTVESNECSDGEKNLKSDECVRIAGSKLNKLWRRLTSQEIKKYRPDKHYELFKPDLERLYEAAKVAVLNDFAHGSLAADLLENTQSVLGNNFSQSSLEQNQQVSIPSLNLCTSSGASNKEEESCEETSGNSLLLGNYSPSTAAENFNQFKCNSGSAILSSSLNQSSEYDSKLSKNKSELNLHPNMRNSSHHAGHGVGLIRSFSDPAIYRKDRFSQDGHIAIASSIETNAALSLESSPRKPSLDDVPPSNMNSVNEKLPPALDPQAERLPVIMATIPTTTPLKDNGDSDESADNNSCVPSTAASSLDTVSHKSCEDFKIISKEQEIQCSSQNISTCVDTPSSFVDNTLPNSHQNTSNIISSALSPEQNITDSKSSYPIASDSNINEYLNEETSLNSKTFVTESNSNYSEEFESEKGALSTYEDDFEITSAELTQIEDLSLPHFESIVDISQPEGDPNDTKNEPNLQGYEKCTMNLPETSGAEKKPDPANPIFGTMQSQLSPAPPPPPPPLPLPGDTTRLQIAVTLAPNSAQLMPDIINELEIRRCQQILIESEKIKQFENSSNVVPYMYVREIPNKPPPPYVPPAHGSPMTTIFPSEERIKEISYRCTHELYCELLKTDYISETGEKLPSVKEEKITNIYERIILDICREYLEEHSEVLTKGNPISFYTQLAFFNPPNRLRCIQESVYKEVRRCLAMDKTLNRRTPMYSVYGQRAKRDHIGKIIIQEMYDEDSKWCNFHREENEVVELIIYEMVGKFVIDIAEEVICKEGDTVKSSNQDNESERNIKQDSNGTEVRQQVSDCRSTKSNQVMQVEEEI